MRSCACTGAGSQQDSSYGVGISPRPNRREQQQRRSSIAPLLHMLRCVQVGVRCGVTDCGVTDRSSHGSHIYFTESSCTMQMVRCKPHQARCPRLAARSTAPPSPPSAPHFAPIPRSSTSRPRRPRDLRVVWIAIWRRRLRRALASQPTAVSLLHRPPPTRRSQRSKHMSNPSLKRGERESDRGAMVWHSRGASETEVRECGR